MEVEWRDQVDDVTGVAVQHQCDLNVNRCEQKTSTHTLRCETNVEQHMEALTLSFSAQKKLSESKKGRSRKELKPLISNAP